MKTFWTLARHGLSFLGEGAGHMSAEAEDPKERAGSKQRPPIG